MPYGGIIGRTPYNDPISLGMLEDYLQEIRSGDISSARLIDLLEECIEEFNKNLKRLKKFVSGFIQFLEKYANNRVEEEVKRFIQLIDTPTISTPTHQVAAYGESLLRMIAFVNNVNPSFQYTEEYTVLTDEVNENVEEMILYHGIYSVIQNEQLILKAQRKEQLMDFLLNMQNRSSGRGRGRGRSRGSRALGNRSR